MNLSVDFTVSGFYSSRGKFVPARGQAYRAALVHAETGAGRSAEPEVDDDEPPPTAAICLRSCLLRKERLAMLRAA
jgi:hypothetical protein